MFKKKQVEPEISIADRVEKAQRELEESSTDKYKVVDNAHMREWGRGWQDFVYDTNCMITGKSCGNWAHGPNCNMCNVPIIYEMQKQKEGKQ